ncbi:MAG: tetratricopeptide repeat protein [bacterium]
MRRHIGLCLLSCILVFANCGKQENRKIKLASGNRTTNIQSAASVLDVTPEEQHSIVILPFENQTADSSLDWLERGLADMLSSELSQSSSIRVVEMSRLVSSREAQSQKTAPMNLEMAFKTARKALINTIISGKFYRDDSGIEIYAALHDVESSRILRKEQVQGENLERIFRMVDELAEKLRSAFRDGIDEEEIASLIHVTESVEALRCYSKALVNFDKFSYTEAAACLNEAIEIDTSFAKAYMLLAKLKFRMGETQDAHAAIMKAQLHTERLSEPDRIWLRLYKAEMDGDISSLLATLKELLQYEPDDPETRMQLAQLLFGLKDYDRARQEYEFILDLDPEEKLAYNHLAYIHAFRGDFRTALKYLDKYEKIAPDEPNPHDSRGEILMMAGRMKEAAKAFKKALGRRPDFDNSIRKLCDVYSELDDLHQALLYFDKQLSETANPVQKAYAYAKRAATYWRFGKIHEAKKNLELAQKTSPNLVATALLGGEMYRSIGETQAARDLYESYYQRYLKVSAEGHLLPMETYGAVRFCMEADLPPEKLIPILTNLKSNETGELQKLQFDMLLGILYLRMGDYEKASQHCEQQRDDFFSLLTQFPSQGRSMSWKYSIEAIELEPRNKQADLSFVTNLLEAAQKAGRKDIEVQAQLFLAQYHTKYERQEEKASVLRKVGMPLEKIWQVVGPFENRSGFDRRFPPEEVSDLKATYDVGDRVLKWQPAHDQVSDGYVDLAAILKPSSWAVGYGVLYVHSPEKRPVQLRLATDEACKLWLNDKVVWQIFRQKDAALDSDIITVMLHPGDNKLLLKVTNSVGDWGFYLRVTDENGDGFEDIEFRSVEEAREPIANRAYPDVGEF